MLTKECPECGHRWRWEGEITLFGHTWHTDDGWRKLAIILMPRNRPRSGWMVNGIIWRRAVHCGPLVIYWLRFDVANLSGESLGEIMYQRTGFMTVEKREELGLEGVDDR